MAVSPLDACREVGVGRLPKTNRALHLIALQQIRHNRQGGGDYCRRKTSTGKTPKEAMRCLKRRIAAKLYRRMLADHARRTPALSAVA